MYSIDLGSVVIQFDQALTSVPSTGNNWNWLAEDWKDVAQAIEISRTGEQVTVRQPATPDKATSLHIVEWITPRIDTEDELIAWFAQKAGTSSPCALEAFKSETFPWGKLVSMNWGTLGYAPGGVEYCLLPEGHGAIALGLLRLDWPTVRILCRSAKLF